VQDTLEEKLCATECGIRQEAREPRITQEMINKMDGQRKWKNVNKEEAMKNYKRLRNEM